MIKKKNTFVYALFSRLRNKPVSFLPCTNTANDPYDGIEVSKSSLSTHVHTSDEVTPNFLWKVLNVIERT